MNIVYFLQEKNKSMYKSLLCKRKTNYQKEISNNSIYKYLKELNTEE